MGDHAIILGGSTGKIERMVYRVLLLTCLNQRVASIQKHRRDLNVIKTVTSAQIINGRLPIGMTAGMMMTGMMTGGTSGTQVLSCHTALMAQCKKLEWALAWQLKKESAECMHVQVEL